VGGVPPKLNAPGRHPESPFTSRRRTGMGIEFHVYRGTTDVHARLSGRQQTHGVLRPAVSTFVSKRPDLDAIPRRMAERLLISGL
jgi:hypothetical protein